MPLLNLADILLQLTIKLGSVRLESGMMGPQKKFHPPIVLDYLKKIIRAEQDLHPFVSMFTIPFDDDRPYFRHKLLLLKFSRYSMCITLPKPFIFSRIPIALNAT